MKRPYSPPQVVSYSSATSPEKQARIAELRAEGLTVAVIAERIGLHKNTVHKYCDMAGLVVRRACLCGRSVRGADLRCYVCRGYRDTRRRAP